MIELRSLTRRYAERVAVDDLSLTVETGALIGGSGSGKSTTLRLVNRLIEPTSGSVWIDGVDTRSEPAPLLRRRIGYCFQQVGPVHPRGDPRPAPRGADGRHDAHAALARLELASERLARERPEALAALRELAGVIDADAMRRMNSAVDAGGRSPADVAREFLRRAD